jgi:hypothetical protein
MLKITKFYEVITEGVALTVITHPYMIMTLIFELQNVNEVNRTMTQ